ncbi:hypothetical protein RJJ65_17655 [Rhizobium hidalgonense]|uniref:Uncharacterized protein n=1 Tax=Rhizobium hidalgonense TaxID=1538159 RepID=A0AAJ2GRQ9_9HYPH|nr:hypothetical protein [Rhizobium hidalgonense]MDR9774457.1 hypothetical protein [Rhizobium hidalgonense]
MSFFAAAFTYEAYNKAIEGAGWDDEPEAPAIGHNLPTDPFEALTPSGPSQLRGHARS